MVYPILTAGQRITTSTLTEMLPLEVVKASAESRTLTTTMSADNDLTLALVASATYEVVFELFYAAILAADIRTEWSVPTGANGFKSVRGPGSASSDGNADNIAMRTGTHLFGTDIVYSGTRNDNTSYCYAREWGLLSTTVAGTLVLNWAQGTSSATSTNIAAGSLLRAKRIG